MSALAPSLPLPAVAGKAGRRGLISGVVVGYLGLIVLLPLAAVVWKSTGAGLDGFFSAITAPETISSLELTVGISLAVVALNAVTGTIVAWVLVRDRFPGISFVNSLIDLPFALPTIVAGVVLLTLYGPTSPVGIDAAYSRWGVLVALLFVTLPFVVRAVQPVLLELDPEMEEAAAALGAEGGTIFRRIILPNLVPAILSGCALGFARAMGEFGSVVLISGNIPYKTEVTSVRIFGLIESDDVAGAAATSVLLLLLSLIALLLVATIEHRTRRYAQ